MGRPRPKQFRDPGGTAGHVMTVQADASFASAAAAGGTGNLKQTKVTSYQTTTALTTVVPWDSSAPLSSEGTQLMTISITPQSTANWLVFRFQGDFSVTNSNAIGIAALFKDSESICRKAAHSSNNAFHQHLAFEHWEQVSSTAAQIWRLRIGPNNGTMYTNGDQFSGIILGATQHKMTFTIQEVAL